MTQRPNDSVFDVHVHVQPWEMMKPSVLALMDDEAHRGVREILESPERLLEELDRNGVERACCINYVAPEVMGFTSRVNGWIAAYTSGYRDRLLPVGSVNPLHSKDVRGDTKRAIDLGIRMIKIHPPHQLFASNAYRFELPTLSELYEECEKAGIPAMIHTGTSVFPGARNIYADPMPVDDVAVDFPDLTLILAHAGRPLYGETALFLARRHPNVHLDLSGIPPKAIPRYVPRLDSITEK
ncbi:MAG: amidohydrolase family protein, partial [Thermoanaerobaculia bacterium]|nr:amidohydrolase family protein [Thermoanaerobaculia bacterium]